MPVNLSYYVFLAARFSLRSNNKYSTCPGLHIIGAKRQLFSQVNLTHVKLWHKKAKKDNHLFTTFTFILMDFKCVYVILVSITYSMFMLFVTINSWATRATSSTCSCLLLPQADCCSLAQVYVTPQRQRRGGEGCSALIWPSNSDCAVIVIAIAHFTLPPLCDLAASFFPYSLPLLAHTLWLCPSLDPCPALPEVFSHQKAVKSLCLNCL